MSPPCYCTVRHCSSSVNAPFELAILEFSSTSVFVLRAAFDWIFLDDKLLLTYHYIYIYSLWQMLFSRAMYMSAL